MSDVDATSLRPDLSRGRSKNRRFPLFTRTRKTDGAEVPIDLSENVEDVERVRFEQELLHEEDPPPPIPAIPGTADDMSAVSISPRPPSVFDVPDEQPESTVPTTAFGSSDEPSYDLKPPPPSISHANIEVLAGRLFSADHLDVILRDQQVSARFKRFLATHRPHFSDILKQYAASRKAVTAVEYANAVADHIPTEAGHPPLQAAHLDNRFATQMSNDLEDLVNEALPAYITHRLTHLVTDTLVKEITQNNAPIMREMIPNLAEVYCITDPSLNDNPIVYASEEFYNVSQYGREYVIGRNCRFLQGPKTMNSTVRRMIEALTTGQEVCETILNYRRDGTPFMNLLLIAPLYDNKGHVRYFLGCQIDVSSLIHGGRGLESLEQLLVQDRSESRFGRTLERDPKHALGRLGQHLNDDEVVVVKSRARSSSEDSHKLAPAPRTVKEPRRIIGADDVGPERPLWPHASLGPSGRLPGVYQNYLLVRPYPSLRITFTSPALRIPGLLQTKFLDRIGGPPHIREGILDALSHGTGVTARIQWLTHPTNSNSSQTSAGLEGKQRWIHCTPLLGSDEKVGVWMIVMVENEEVTGSLRRPAPDASIGAPIQLGAVNSSSPSGVASPRYNTNKLYAEYLRREGRPSMEAAQTPSPRRAREPDDHVLEF